LTSEREKEADNISVRFQVESFGSDMHRISRDHC
jgi:hypothetical protein